jgi:hypothetical protein
MVSLNYDRLLLGSALSPIGLMMVEDLVRAHFIVNYCELVRFYGLQMFSLIHFVDSVHLDNAALFM